MSAKGHPRPRENPRGFAAAFVAEEEVETAALAAMRARSPWLATVLSAQREVTWADPPVAARPTEPLALADAATCAAQLCDAVARLHAEGWAGLGTAPADVRVTRDEDGWRATLVVPHLPHEGRTGYAASWAWYRRAESATTTDLAAVVGFFRDLLEGYVPEPLRWFRAPMDYVDRALPPFAPDAVRATLAAVLAGETREALPADAASLALVFGELTRDPEAWRARVATMPRARPRVAHHDWVRLTELGERELAARPGDAYVILPLAAGWHQRACEAFAEGRLEAAARCVTRALALDPWCRYHVTRGAIREARGDLAGAVADFTEGFDSIRRMAPPDAEEPWWWSVPSVPEAPAEVARALYARGVTRYRLGDPAGARDDLREAKGYLGPAGLDPATGLETPVDPHADLRARIARALAAEGLAAPVRAG